MVSVKHARHPIEAEAIKHVLVHVVTEVGEEESEDFVVAVVEEAAVVVAPSSVSPEKGKKEGRKREGEGGKTHESHKSWFPFTPP
jgi:hypothetical protein